MTRERSDSDNEYSHVDAPEVKRRKVVSEISEERELVQKTRYDRTAIQLTPTIQSTHPLTTWIAAKPATDRHYLTQATSCSGVRVYPPRKAYWKLNGPIQKCRTCTERVRGTICRFQGVRAFAAMLTDEQIEMFDVKDRKAGGYVVTEKKLVRPCALEILETWPCIKGFRVGEWPDVKDWVLVGNTDPDKMAVFDPAAERSPHGVSPGVRAIEKVLSKAHDDACLSRVDEEAQSILRLTASTLHAKLQQVAKYFPHADSETGWSRAQGALSTPIILRAREPDERVVCDACGTTCFLCSWMCMVCGNELCVDCWEEWQPASADFGADGAESSSGVFVPRLDQCLYQRRHTRAQFYLVNRANISEVKWLLERTASELWKIDLSDASNVHPQETPKDDVADATRPFRTPYIFPSISAQGTPAHQAQEALFQQVWHASGDRDLGVPVVIHGISSPLLDSLWAPEYFKARYGKEKCQVVDCDSSETTSTTVADFFDAFTLAEKSVKLKDWPPQTDFAEHCPRLFEDFEGDLLPFPKHMARTGFMNLASMFPEKGVCVPDLGPKCYIASAAPGFLTSSKSTNGNDDTRNAEQKEGTTDKGTTNLHLDVTDAINIMAYAAPSPTQNSKPTPPAATWHIFPPSSTPTINAYLRQKHHHHQKDQPIDDPINRQLFYLNTHDLTALSTGRWGFTRAYLIHQEPGDAVLIPAGCAHQVANGRSCIKVAVDFISPERIHVCAGIMRMFRDLAGQYVYRDGGADNEEAETEADGGGGERNKDEAKGPQTVSVSPASWRLGPKEDILQLYDCLYFAWFQIAALARKRRLKETCARLLGIEIGPDEDEDITDENKDTTSSDGD